MCGEKKKWSKLWDLFTQCSYLRWLRGSKFQGDSKVGSLLLFLLSFVALSLLTSAGVTKRPKLRHSDSSLLRLFNFAQNPRGAPRYRARRSLQIPPYRVPFSSHYAHSPLSVLQGMSLAILSGWISPEKGTTRVTTMHGGSLTCWIWITSATVSSTPLTGTWTEPRTSTAGWLANL